MEALYITCAANRHSDLCKYVLSFRPLLFFKASPCSCASTTAAWALRDLRCKGSTIHALRTHPSTRIPIKYEARCNTL